MYDTIQSVQDAAEHEFITIDDTTFYALFEPVPGEYDDQWEWDDVRDLPTEHVWTVVEAEDNLIAAPGFHVVNRLYYMVTEHPWPTDAIDVLLHTFESDDEDDDDDFGCEGHESLAGEHMGETVYCDGSCRKGN